MKKLMRWARCGALFLLFAGLSAGAQQMTPISASSIKMGGVPIAGGLVTLLPVDANGKAIPIAESGLHGPMAWKCSIAAGAITGTCAVPDACQATPANVDYTITIMNTATNQSFTLPKVPNICGSSWALDAYAPPATTSNLQPMIASGGPNAPTSACNVPAIYTQSGTANVQWQCKDDHTWVQLSGSGGGISITSTYDVYQIEVVSLLPATNNVELEFLVSTNGGTSWQSANYFWNYSYAGTSGDAGAQGGGLSSAYAKFATSASNSTTGGGVTSTLKFYAPLSTSAAKILRLHTEYFHQNGAYYSLIGGGGWNGTTAVNAFSIKFTSGNIASGMVRLYGVAH